MTKHNLTFTINVKCDKCGKIGNDHDIPTLQFPDGSFRAICSECQEKEGKRKS